MYTESMKITAHGGQEVRRMETTQKVAHTSGAWRNRHFNEFGSIDITAPAYRMNDEPRNVVARVYPPVRFQEPTLAQANAQVAECEANARLITGAPDLLVACKSALEAFDKCGSDFAAWNCQDAVQLLQAAIANAEGR